MNLFFLIYFQYFELFQVMNCTPWAPEKTMTRFHTSRFVFFYSLYLVIIISFIWLNFDVKHYKRISLVLFHNKVFILK